MGACNFDLTWDGTNYKDGFTFLSQEAMHEYGWDAYNGTISTTSLVGTPHKIAERYSKTAERKAQQWLENHDWGRKWECRVLDLGVVGYEVSKFVKVPHTKADAQFQTRYVAYADEREIGTYKTAAEARKELERAIALPRYARTEYFHVEKKAVRVSGKSTTTVAYERQTRVVKTKPKTAPRGTTVTPVHRFLYYGWASC